MSNRTQVLLSIGISLAATLALLLNFYSAVTRLTIEQQQVDSSRQVASQLRLLQACTVRHFMEAIERNVVGDEETEELQAARAQANMSFERLKELNTAEMLALSGNDVDGEEEEEKEEKEELLRMQALFDDQTQQIESVLALEQTVGHHETLQALVKVTEEGFDDLLAPMIETAIQRESRQVRRREARLDKAVWHLRMIAVAGGIVTLFVLTLASRLILSSFTQTAVAEKAAQAINRSKSEFLANMSHEIRTPMTAILGFAENLEDRDQPEREQLNAIHTIRRNGEYLLSIINDILDLSKIEAGMMVVERIPCQPCRIVAEVDSLMRVRTDAKNLQFNFEYVGEIPETIRTDATRLRQILINLIGNAIKFTEAGVVRLVTRFVDEDDDPCLQFDVIDNGRGMSEKQRANLFQPFMQGDASTTREFGGSGLGLTISRRFAELLGGDISLVETEEGHGSTFRATVTTGSIEGVKMLTNPTSATVVIDVASTDAQATQSELCGCRILLAEDGPDNQCLISNVLKKVGAVVTIAADGRLALDAALNARDEAEPFDCILMDMQMPVMDGYDATRKLRQKGYTGPIIALTAHAMESDRQKCIDAGCDDYQTKPIMRKNLIEAIRKYLPASLS